MKTILKEIITQILKLEASIVLRRYKPKIIVVAGSVGKTSTKDAIFTAVSPFINSRKSDKSFNSEIGLPLTILGLPNGWNSPVAWLKNLLEGLMLGFGGKVKYPELLILEVGTDRPGDMDKVSKWIKSNIAVLTRCPPIPVHVEFFKNPHDLNEEDKKIVKTLIKTGVMILNADDEEIMNLKERNSHRVITYGFNLDSNVKASHEEIQYDENQDPIGMNGKIHVGNLAVPFKIKSAIGRHHIYPLLAACAVAEELKLNMVEVIEKLSDYNPPKGRMKIIKGINDSNIIDDTYNSSPVALEEALKTLGSIKTFGRKVAVLGDMLELGKFTIREHKRLGSFLTEFVDVLVTIGQRAEDFALGAKEAHMRSTSIHAFTNVNEAITYLSKHVKDEDIVLVKGSQGMRMERIVKVLMKEPEKAKEILVRQEPQWIS